MNITPPHPQHSHEENLLHLSGLPGTADRATRLGEVPHLSCESSQEKKRDCMERLVNPPRWGTSPTWGPPPPCEQALNPCKPLCRHFLTSLFLPTYEATYTAGYLLPTDDRYREHHDHIWIVLQFVE